MLPKSIRLICRHDEGKGKSAPPLPPHKACLEKVSRRLFVWCVSGALFESWGWPLCQVGLSAHGVEVPGELEVWLWCLSFDVVLVSACSLLEPFGCLYVYSARPDQSRPGKPESSSYLHTHSLVPSLFLILLPFVTREVPSHCRGYNGSLVALPPTLPFLWLLTRQRCSNFIVIMLWAITWVGEKKERKKATAQVWLGLKVV